MQKKTRIFIRNSALTVAFLALLFLFIPRLIPTHDAGATITGHKPHPVSTAIPGGILTPTSNGGYQHVFLIVMENVGYSSLIGNANAPWINTAAQTYAIATNSHGVAHPSEPNYLALTSGSTQGIRSDRTVTVNAPNLVDQLEARGKTWKAYMQSLSSHGNTDKLATSAGDYARKHNPFVSYADIQHNPARMARIVDFSQFAGDLANSTVPDFVWITPDMCHDMHGRAANRPNDPCSSEQKAIHLGDTFLRTTIAAIMQSPAWTGKSVIFITWDEDDTSSNSASGCCGANPGGGHILTLAIERGQQAPRSSHTPYNHYSLLATLESAWQLGCLAATCDTAHVQPMRDLLP